MSKPCSASASATALVTSSASPGTKYVQPCEGDSISPGEPPHSPTSSAPAGVACSTTPGKSFPSSYPQAAAKTSTEIATAQSFAEQRGDLTASSSAGRRPALN